MIKKEPGPTPDSVRITFEMPNTVWAESVNLLGDFNEWNPTSLPMSRGRDDGNWHIMLTLQRGREYQFRYLVNGTEWHNDWDADRHVPNMFGGDNSVLVL